MGFTTPCFIRKNTPELRKKLEYLGYSHGKPEYYADDDDNEYDFIMCHNGRFFLLSQKNHVIRNGHPLKKHGSINCGTNESLFLAIAALRDDTDKNQWFVLDHDNIWEAVGCYQYKGDFILCNHDRWYCGTDVAQAHKATVKELQELFSQNIQAPQIEWNINDVINKDSIMEQNKKEVVFDGKDLIFNVDGIEIKNGKLPDSFSIKERYEISAESISMLVVALGDGNTLAEFTDVQEGFSFSRKTRAIYSLKDKYVKKLVEEIAKLENKVNSLQEEVYAERRKASDEGYKRYLLENLIKEHNKRSWWGRAEKIELKTEE